MRRIGIATLESLSTIPVTVTTIPMFGEYRAITRSVGFTTTPRIGADSFRRAMFVEGTFVRRPTTAIGRFDTDTCHRIGFIWAIVFLRNHASHSGDTKVVHAAFLHHGVTHADDRFTDGTNLVATAELGPFANPTETTMLIQVALVAARRRETI